MFANDARRDNGSGYAMIPDADDTASTMRIDLHLHSIVSGASTNWWVKGLGLGLETRESYTPPAQAYDLAKAAGMDFVTLTDHETIDGALTLASRPDFLVGVEVGTTFPEDGSNADVLVFGADAAAHAELQARRHDVYQVVDFLREAGLVHVLAHPLFEVGAPLGRAGVEKRLALFGLWEFINGSRPESQNRLTQQVARMADASDIRQAAMRHGLRPPPHRAIAGTGGSDDHGGVYPGHTWTEVPRVSSVQDLLAAIAAGEVAPGGTHGSVEKMAATGFRILAGAASEGQKAPAVAGAASPIGNLIPGRATDVEKLLEYLPLLQALDGSQVRALLTARYEQQLSDALGDPLHGPHLLRILGSLGSMVDAHLYLTPYLGVHGYFGRERQKTRALRRELLPGQAEPLKVGIFVDDLDEIHGVGTMYRHLQQLASGPGADRLTLVRCGDGAAANIVNLRAIAHLRLPLYDSRSLAVPSILDVFDHVASEGYDVLHIATPGPLGLAAMATGIALGLPIVGAYHTEFGSYAQILSGDSIVAEIVEVLVREFYERCAVVAVPSQSTAESLKTRGYRVRHVETLKNGVDTAQYRPDRRDDTLHAGLGGGRCLLLYVGRVSREKGLTRLAESYAALRQRRDDVHLVVVGDGPYRAEMAAALGDTATFTGFLRGDDLARMIASCDIFAFPSTTDTLGRAVAEAQASGLPAVVFGVGGPRECIQPGVSGFVAAPDDDAAFIAHIERLVDDPALRARMGAAASAFAGTLSWENVREGLVQLYHALEARPVTPLAAGLPG